MIPRTAISALPLSTTLEEAKVSFRTLGYSRMPVYRERLDDVVGIIFRRDLEPYLENPHLTFTLKEITRPLDVHPGHRQAGGGAEDNEIN
ncbi:hypothetical protein BH20ACI3_BH20ACI3_29120 [soil metagenome]